MKDKDYRKVLMITYAFPPMPGPGVQRSAKFVKYLPKYAWLPYVITTKYLGYDADNSLVKDIPENVKVITVGKIKGHSINKRQGYNKQKSIIYEMLKRLKQSIYTLFLLPDDKIFWAILALPKCLSVIYKEKIKVIYSTSDPYSSHILAYAIKRLTGVKWMADFRDPWVDSYTHSNRYYRGMFSDFRKRIDLRIESAVLKCADSVMCTTEDIRRSFISKIGAQHSEKIHFIPNGFDNMDYINKKQGSNSDENRKCVVLYSGGFQSVSPKIFFELIQNIKLSNPHALEDVIFKFIGKKVGVVEETIESLGIRDVVETIDYMSHNNIVREQIEADALLLILDNANKTHNQMVVPAKMFEYMATNKPMLALVVDGPARRILDEYYFANIIDPDDPNAKQLVIEFIDLLKNGKIHFGIKKSIEVFDRKYITGKVALILKEISNGDTKRS